MKTWQACGSEKSTATWVGDENNKRVCTMKPSETDWENCQLMAAAPDLLDILDRILRAHESGNNGAVMGEAKLCKSFAYLARSAINKAKGL